MKVKLPYQVVLLLRGEGSKTPITVMPHEVEILKCIHGEDNILITDDTPPVKFGSFETADEYNRLEEYYKGDGENTNPTRRVFRNIEEFESAFESTGGVNSKGDLLEEAKSLGIKANKNWGIDKLQVAIKAAKAIINDGDDGLGNEG